MGLGGFDHDFLGLVAGLLDHLVGHRPLGHFRRHETHVREGRRRRHRGRLLSNGGVLAAWFSYCIFKFKKESNQDISYLVKKLVVYTKATIKCWRLNKIHMKSSRLNF